MLKEFYAKNYRSFKEVKLHDLKRINVLTGANGCGKTSLLEIPFLLAGANNARLAMSLYNFRNESEISPGYDRYFKDIFHDLNISNTINMWSLGKFKSNGKTDKRTLKITPVESLLEGLNGSSIGGLKFAFRGPKGPSTGKIFWESKTESVESSVKSKLQHRLALKIPPSKDQINAYFVSPYYRELWQQTHKLLTELTKLGKIESVVESLKIIEPRLKNLHPLSEEGINVLYADIDKGYLIPVSLLGGGFVNMLHIILDTSATNDGIVLIDEIEDGLHFSIIKKLIEFLFTVSKKNNLQLFVSTHSEEIIDAFTCVSKENNFSDIGLFRVSRKEGIGNVTQFTMDEIISSRDMNAELR